VDYPTSTVDNPAENIILSSNGSGPAPRFVLGPASVVYDGKTAAVTGTIIKSAYAQLDTSSDQWTVVFDLTGTGTNLFNADATLYYGRLIADDLGGTVISAPIIEARRFPGSGEVAGNFTKESADELAAELNSGALPVEVGRVSTLH
jgi:preprotein translocase subunit SecD